MIIFAPMKFTITEVQITCIVIMGLVTMILAFFLPGKKRTGKIFNTARKLLACGTALFTLHFIVQYGLHKPVAPSPELRTVINLLFGFPMSLFMTSSLLYLQRRGHIKVHEWLISPLLLFLALMLIAISVKSDYNVLNMHQTNIIISCMYALMLLYYRTLQVIEYFKLRKIIRVSANQSLIELNKWSRWVIISMTIVDIGLPIMTFNTDLFMRSVYGLFSLIVTFFAIFSFIGYGFYSAIEFEITERGKNEEHIDEDIKKLEEEETSNIHIDQEKLDAVAKAAQQMIASRFFTEVGITQKDVAERMGISRGLLTAWLQTTDYKQYNIWITFLRIAESKRIILEHPDWSNETVAQACGFRDRTYFQRQFKKFVGETPAKWQENNTEELQ